MGLPCQIRSTRSFRNLASARRPEIPNMRSDNRACEDRPSLRGLPCSWVPGQTAIGESAIGETRPAHPFTRVIPAGALQNISDVKRTAYKYIIANGVVIARDFNKSPHYPRSNTATVPHRSHRRHFHNENHRLKLTGPFSASQIDRCLTKW